MKVQIGSVVRYQLSKQDAEAIDRRRHDASRASAGEQQTGFIVHVGNSAREGQVFPAFVVADFGTAKNLQVFLDGNDTYWATSRNEGDKPGQWQLFVWQMVK